MAEKTFKELMVIAERVYAISRHEDREHATLTIVEALGMAYTDGCQDTLNEVQSVLSMSGVQ